jgi:SAM-dependent methyltransferase
VTKKIVHRIEDDTDRQDVLCTTYQMRNFYRQLQDAMPSALDVFNYIQHHQIAKTWCKAGDHVLDVCCGRGLMLPLLRYHAKDIGSYTGVEIEEKNAVFMHQRVNHPGVAADPEDYYPFPVSLCVGNAAEMAAALGRKYNVIIYTSALEHMHPDHGYASLEQCREVIADDGILVLTCPKTPEDKDGYDTQYRAHVYEWKESELNSCFEKVGFSVVQRWGLLANGKDIKFGLDQLGAGWVYDYLRSFIPVEWLHPVLAPMVPDEAKEIGYLLRPTKRKDA